MSKSDLDEIYRLYAKYIYRYLFSLCSSEELAEELTSETFFRAVQNIDSYRPDYPISQWLKAIAHNLFINHLRKKERQNISLEDDILPDTTDLIIRTEDKEQTLNIHKALHTLDEPYKEVFSLRIFGELSFKDIGGIFGRSDGWARTVFFRAKDKLINKLKETDTL